MRNSMKNFSLMFFLFIILLSSNIYPNDNKWNIDIKLSKQDYMLHEPIWLDILLTNNTSSAQRTHGLEQPNHRQFYINLKDDIGKLIKHTGWNFSIMPTPGNLVLEPGEQEFGSFDLLELYRSPKSNSGYTVLPLRFPFIPKGAYTIQVNFEENFSNELSINIVEPFGDEKKTLELIEEASSVLRKDDYDPAGQKFQEVVDKFPNSVFAASCYRLSRTFTNDAKQARKAGTFDKVGLRRELIQKFPNSGSTKSWLYSITNKLDDNQKIEIINKLISENPNTKIAKFAKQMLQGMPNKMEK